MTNTFNHALIKIPEISAHTQDNGKRFYRTPEGKMYPSVTTVLSLHNKEGLAQWRARVGNDEANKISRQAATRGTRIHNIVERYLNNNGVKEGLTPLDLASFISLQTHLSRIDNIRGLEVGLYSDFLRLAGRVDCVADFDGKLSIIDFKTAKRRKDKEYIEHYFMQTSAYAIMFEERTGIPIGRTVILISVDDDDSQVFIEKRDNYDKKLIEYRDLWESINKNAG